MLSQVFGLVKVTEMNPEILKTLLPTVTESLEQIVREIALVTFGKTVNVRSTIAVASIRSSQSYRIGILRNFEDSVTYSYRIARDKLLREIALVTFGKTVNVRSTVLSASIRSSQSYRIESVKF